MKSFMSTRSNRQTRRNYQPHK